jgi:excisionase family DNA binding protein
METLVHKLLARTGLLTIAEVSDLFGFHEVTLRNWVRAGKLPAARIAGHAEERNGLRAAFEAHT